MQYISPLMFIQATKKKVKTWSTAFTPAMMAAAKPVLPKRVPAKTSTLMHYCGFVKQGKDKKVEVDSSSEHEEVKAGTTA